MGIRLSIADNTCVIHSSPFVCLPHVYTCFAHELPSGKSLDCGSCSNSSEDKDTLKAILVMHACTARG